MATVAEMKYKVKTDRDGVVEEQEYTQTYRRGEEPPYIKLYIADVLYLSDMPRRYEALTLALLKRVSYAGQENGLCVVINKGVKDTIIKEIGWKNTQSVDNAIKVLVNGKILYRQMRGIYMFNPHLFGRGDWGNVASLRLSIDYNDIKGRTFSVNAGLKKTEEDEFWERVNSDEKEDKCE